MKKVRALTFLCLLAGGVLSAQTITVTKPAAGETWVRGQTYSITWTTSGVVPNLFRISLRDAATLNEALLIADNSTTPNTVSWTVPANIADGTYRVRVKAKNLAVQGDSGAFKISATAGPIIITPRDPGPRVPIALKFPALVIYQAGMVPYDDKFEVTFGYKNSGTGNLPKNSDMPVKPNFRVVVDGRQVNQGNLVIPAFPAPPGWEMPTFFACSIPRQAAGSFDYTTNVGQTMSITINENKVNGMDTCSQSYNLRNMALNYGYDLGINEATLDFNTGVLTALVRLDGVFKAGDEMELFDENIFHYPGYDWWHVTAKAVAGQHLYTLSRKRDGVTGTSEHKVALRVHLKRVGEAVVLKDIDHRNNKYDRVFHR